MPTLTLRVITPDKIALDQQVSAVTVPGTDGQIGILPRHAPMIAALDAGPLRYTADGKKGALFASGGFAEVRGETATVVTDAGEYPGEIHEARAREAEKRAPERIAVARVRWAIRSTFCAPKRHCAARSCASVRASTAGAEALSQVSNPPRRKSQYAALPHALAVAPGIRDDKGALFGAQRTLLQG